MKIYFTPSQDPMLLDSLKGMNAIHEKLQSFLSSASKTYYLEASQRGGPEPYDELLAGLEIQKGDCPINLSPYERTSLTPHWVTRQSIKVFQLL